MTSSLFRTVAVCCAVLVPLLPTADAFTRGVADNPTVDGAIVRSSSGTESNPSLFVTTYAINAGVTMTLSGITGINIYATESITINGILDASGKGSGGGALGSTGTTGLSSGGGGSTASSGAAGGVKAAGSGGAANTRYLAIQQHGSGNSVDYLGSGGGGGQTGVGGVSRFGGAGGGGGPCAAGGTGGAAGALTATSGVGGTGGAGGGFIHLFAPTIIIGPSGGLKANGASGNPATGTAPHNSAGGGGGAGGTIQLTARSILEQPGSLLEASGGPGGLGGGTGGAGAAGGTGGTIGCNAGSAGASPTNGGGGGGGGAGGILFRHLDNAMNWKGAWASSTLYVVGDVVLRDGAAYVARTVHTNADPLTNADDWDIQVRNGDNGYSGLSVTMAEPFGVNCAEGGQRLQVGLDNGDGGGTAYDFTLQPGEVDTTSYICNGTGPAGPQGDPGPIGIAWQGVWDSATAYAARDAVQHAGAVWYALLPNTGSEPGGSSADWSFVLNAAVVNGMTAAEERTNWLAALSDIAWLLWLIGFLLTRLVRQPPIRVLTDLAVCGLLTLPLDGVMRGLIVGANSLVFFLDCLVWGGVLPRSKWSL